MLVPLLHARMAANRCAKQGMRLQESKPIPMMAPMRRAADQIFQRTELVLPVMPFAERSREVSQRIHADLCGKASTVSQLLVARLAIFCASPARAKVLK